MTTAVLPFTIRQSSLVTAKCLHRFNETIVKGVREPSTEFAARGTDFHKLHQLYVQRLVETQQEYDFDFAEGLCANPSLSLEAIRLWRGWYPSAILDPSKIYGTEVKLTLGADLDPAADPYMYSGEFDRLEIESDSATIIDIKTNFAPFDPDTIQSVMYPWLLRHHMPHIKHFTFELQFVRWHISRAREFDAGDIDRLEREMIMPLVDRLRQAVAQDQWPATPNAACSYCSIPCPLITNGVTKEMIGQIDSPEVAGQMADELYVLEQRTDRVKAQLKGYCAEFGPIQRASGIILGFQKRTSKEYSPKKIVELNERHGFDKLRALAGDNAEIKKISKRYPEFISELAKTAKDNSTTTFGFSRE